MAIGDTSFPSVVLLLTPDENTDSTAIGDLSTLARTILLTGNVRFRPEQFRFGTSSIYFDGTGDRLTLVSSAANDLGSTFTLEFSIYPFTLPGSGNLCRLFMFGIGGQLTSFTCEIKSDGTIQFIVAAGGTTLIASAANTVTLNAWNDFELSVNAGSARIYKGTNSIAGPTTITTPTSSSGGNTLLIGYDNDPNPIYNYNFNGHLDNCRITKGVARNTGATKATVVEHPPYWGQVKGVIRDDLGALTARTVRAIRRDTGAQVASTTSDAVTGAYTLNCPTLDEICRIVHDDAAGTLYNDLIDRVIPG